MGLMFKDMKSVSGGFTGEYFKVPGALDATEGGGESVYQCYFDWKAVSKVLKPDLLPFCSSLLSFLPDPFQILSSSIATRRPL